MKNFELKFWMSCIMLALCVGFTSCGDDDEGGIAGDANELIIGTWESTWMKGWEKYLDDDDKWKTDSYDGVYTEDTYIFKKGGTGTYKYSYDGYSDEYEITWKIKDNNKLIITEYGYDEEYTITTLNTNTAVIVWHDKDEDGEEEYTEITFKKK